MAAPFGIPPFGCEGECRSNCEKRWSPWLLSDSPTTGAGHRGDRPLLCTNVLRLLLAGDALVGDVAGLEVLGGQLAETVEELLPVGDDVLDRDVDVVLGDGGHDVDRVRC